MPLTSTSSFSGARVPVSRCATVGGTASRAQRGGWCGREARVGWCGSRGRAWHAYPSAGLDFPLEARAFPIRLPAFPPSPTLGFMLTVSAPGRAGRPLVWARVRGAAVNSDEKSAGRNVSCWGARTSLCARTEHDR